MRERGGAGKRSCDNREAGLVRRPTSLPVKDDAHPKNVLNSIARWLALIFAVFPFNSTNFIKSSSVTSWIFFLPNLGSMSR
jgi:hypothetical protein